LAVVDFAAFAPREVGGITWMWQPRRSSASFIHVG